MLADRLLVEIWKWARAVVAISVVVIVTAITAAALLEFGLLTLSHGRETVQHALGLGVLGLVGGGAGLYVSRWGRGL